MNRGQIRTGKGASPAGLEDEALLRLVAGGDYDAFTELYSRYERVAYGLSLRVIGNRELAEDAFVEGLVTVWRAAKSFDPERGSARAWILTIVHRRAVDLVRREERHRTYEEVEPVEAHDIAADDAVVLREEGTRVRGALRRLPERERELIELAYFGGYTQSQLAATLGISLGTVKSRMFSGLARMREFLRDDRSTPARLEVVPDAGAALSRG